MIFALQNVLNIANKNIKPDQSWHRVTSETMALFCLNAVTLLFYVQTPWPADLVKKINGRAPCKSKWQHGRMQKKELVRELVLCLVGSEPWPPHLHPSNLALCGNNPWQRASTLLGQPHVIMTHQSGHCSKKTVAVWGSWVALDLVWSMSQNERSWALAMVCFGVLGACGRSNGYSQPALSMDTICQLPTQLKTDRTEERERDIYIYI